MINVERNKIQFALLQLLFGLCAVAFGCVIISPNISAKVLGVAGVTALVIFLFDIKKIRANDAFWFCLVLAIIGICDLVWYRMYKVHSEAINSYRAYLEVGKICLFGAFSIFVMVNRNQFKVGCNKIHMLLVIILQVMIVMYAGYQHLYIEDQRVTLSLAGGADATGAAYTIAFISFYTILVLQHSLSRWKDLFILGHFFITFLVLVATETRGAILPYPIIFFALLMVKVYKEKHIPWKGISVFLIALLAGIFMMKDSLIKRYNDFNNDIVSYEKANSGTSVGARFAMWKVGLAASKNNYFWQSTDERNIKILEAINKDPSLSGALDHIRGHLHNEIVETLSVKGYSGVILYFLFIISLGWYALHKRKSIILFAFLVSIIMFGLSGVMFYSKTTPVAWMLTLIMSVVFLEQNKHRDVIK